jgi:hypothetical protein
MVGSYLARRAVGVQRYVRCPRPFRLFRVSADLRTLGRGIGSACAVSTRTSCSRSGSFNSPSRIGTRHTHQTSCADSSAHQAARLAKLRAGDLRVLVPRMGESCRQYPVGPQVDINCLIGRCGAVEQAATGRFRVGEAATGPQVSPWLYPPFPASCPFRFSVTDSDRPPHRPARAE